LIPGKTVGSDFPVQIPIADSGAFQACSERFRAPVGHKVLDCNVDEPAPLSRPGHPTNGLDGCLGKNNVDAFAHRV
jgi:hypothetical protein